MAIIGKTGRGPGEINQIEDLDIDKETQIVYMVSGWQQKFYVYSPNGEFIRSFNVPSYVREFRFFEDNILCFCGRNRGDNKDSFILIDKSGHLLKSFPNEYQFKSKSGYGFTHENSFMYLMANYLSKNYVQNQCIHSGIQVSNLILLLMLVKSRLLRKFVPNVI